MSQRVGVIGSGAVGQTLAAGFHKHKYDVRIASRTPAKLADFSKKSGIQADTFGNVAKWAEIIVLAVKGTGAEAALGECGAANLKGKIVIDTTNPIADKPPVDGVVQVFTGPNDSLMERLQSGFPDAKLVKAWNSVGNARMVNPSFKDGKPSMFYCGNDAGAKGEVAKILEQFGWEAVDMGKATAARAIEPLCQLWCIPGFLKNSWSHAFKVVWN